MLAIRQFTLTLVAVASGAHTASKFEAHISSQSNGRVGGIHYVGHFPKI